MDEKTYLKVKIKSLAEEARIIRQEAKRARMASIRDGLNAHRTGIVRYEARHTYLAYGFLKGREYKEIEHKAKEAPDWDKIRRMVERYGSHIGYESEGFSYDFYKLDKKNTLERFEEWLTRARAVSQSA